MRGWDVTTATLTLLTGPWSAGKTTVARQLPELLPDHVVFDWDLIIPGITEAAGKNVYTDPSTWDGLKTTWLAIIEAVLTGGHDVVLCGPATPADLEGRLGGARVGCAYLDCSDGLLGQRLRARGEPEDAVADELAYAERLRHSGYAAIRVNDRSLREIAESFVGWLATAHLPET